MKTNPTIRIRPRDLLATPEGQQQWALYREEIIRLSLQHENHFAEEIARFTIPDDAENHEVYIYPGDGFTLRAFCVVLKTHLEAEMLWAAPDDRLFRASFYFAEVFRKVELDCFSENSAIRMIYAKVGTPESKWKDSKVGGLGWHRTNTFYEKHMGYEFLYSLDHYWANGDHALLMVKHREDQLLGYDSLPTNLRVLPETDFSKVSYITPQEKFEIQQEIEKDIRKYIQQFELEADWIHQGLERAPTNSEKFNGFVGVGFFPKESPVATIFASEISDKDAKDLSGASFEFTINHSAFTKILQWHNSDNSPVVIHYPLEWDEKSALKVADYFKEFIPDADILYGFSLFIHSLRSDEGGHTTIYAVTPAIKNVVLSRQNWKNFALYSYPMLWGIYETLRVLEETLFQQSTYIESLLGCIRTNEKLKELVQKNENRTKIQQLSVIQGANAHDLRGVLQGCILTLLVQGQDHIEKGEIEKGLQSLDHAADAIENLCNNLGFFINAFKKLLSEQKVNLQVVLDEELITSWQHTRLRDPLRLEGIYSPKLIHFEIPQETIQIMIPKESLEALLHIVIDNSMSAMRNHNVCSDQQNLVQVSFRTNIVNKKNYCCTTIWNRYTQFPSDILKLAGPRPYSARSQKGHSGFGFFILETLLRISKARKTEPNRHFTLQNTTDPLGASVSFEIPCSNNLLEDDGD